jgi:hypothetical protein
MPHRVDADELYGWSDEREVAPFLRLAVCLLLIVQLIKVAAETRIRFVIVGSMRIAEATSVAAPIINTVKRLSLEKRFEVSIRNFTAGLERGVFAFSSGTSPP